MKRTSRHLLALLLLFFCSTKAFSSDHFTSISTRPYSSSEQMKHQPLQFGVGFTTGWKAPYGTGLDFSFLIKEIVDVNFGCGISPWGVSKIGLGTRIYPIRNTDFSPMLGVYLFESSGKDLTFEKHYFMREPDIAKYRIKPDKAVQINVGFRARSEYEDGFYTNVGVGYSFGFKNEEAEYLSGSTLDELRSRANIYRIGGFSINLGISYFFSL